MSGSPRRAMLVGALGGFVAWAALAVGVNADSERYVLVASLPGAVILPAVWGRWLAARRTRWRHLAGLALPFLNVPITGFLGWLLGVIFGPRGGVIGRLGGLVGVLLGSPLGAVVFAWYLLPVGLVTVLFVGLAARPAR